MATRRRPESARVAFVTVFSTRASDTTRFPHCGELNIFDAAAQPPDMRYRELDAGHEFDTHLKGDHESTTDRDRWPR
jgi:hypothetical protein